MLATQYYKRHCLEGNSCCVFLYFVFTVSLVRSRCYCDAVYSVFYFSFYFYCVPCVRFHNKYLGVLSGSLPLNTGGVGKIAFLRQMLPIISETVQDGLVVTKAHK